MLKKFSITSLWLMLMSLTILSALIAESAESGVMVTVAIALVIAIKGRVVVDRFMELIDANIYIRKLMRIYFYVIPTLIVLTDLYPEFVVQITTLR